MFRKLVCAIVVMTVSLGFAAAENIRGVVKKVDGQKLTVQKTKKSDEKGKPDVNVGEPVVITVAENAKIAKGKFNADTKKFEAGEAIPDGLKNEIFAKIGEKGVNVNLTTNDANVATEVIVRGGGKKKKDAK